MKSSLIPRTRIAFLLGFGLISLLLHGCGGSDHNGASATSSGSAVSAHAAQATVTVNWPARPKISGARPRLIPLAANSITISITQGDHAVAKHTLAALLAIKPLLPPILLALQAPPPSLQVMLCQLVR